MSDDRGHLLVPLLDVERNIANRSTRVTFEIRDILMLGSKQEFTEWLRASLTEVGDMFLYHWKSFTR